MRAGGSGFGFDVVVVFASGFNGIVVLASTLVFEFASETAASSVGDGTGVAATVASGDGDGNAAAAPE